MTDQEIFKKLVELKLSGLTVALATIVETVGSTPREVGAKMIVCVDGTLHFNHPKTGTPPNRSHR
jgi:xanthine/CO dehydrogenase XdhC/CoxF family maturation factor